MELSQRVEAASFRYLISYSTVPLIGSITASLLVALSHLEAGHTYRIIAWLCFVNTMAGVQLWLTVRSRARFVAHGYRRNDGLGFAAVISFSGIAWGMAVLLPHNADSSSLVVTTTVTQAMVMGGVVILGTYLPAFLAFSLPAILPMIFVYASGGGVTNAVLAAYCLIFLALMIGIAIRFNKLLRDTWRLGFEKEDLVSALTEAHDQMTTLARTDGLTGIANRRHFDTVLDTEFARLRRSGAPLSLIFIDVDHFKAFNDTYGHIAGDQCLREVSAVLGKLLLRAPDFAGRYGGEEFAVILPETDHAGALLLAEKIRTEVAALAIPHSASAVESCVTVSLGVATVDCANVGSANEALSMADRQLYIAKREGRNRLAAVDISSLTARSTSSLSGA